LDQGLCAYQTSCSGISVLLLGLFTANAKQDTCRLQSCVQLLRAVLHAAQTADGIESSTTAYHARPTRHAAWAKQDACCWCCSWHCFTHPGLVVRDPNRPSKMHTTLKSAVQSVCQMVQDVIIMRAAAAGVHVLLTGRMPRGRRQYRHPTRELLMAVAPTDACQSAELWHGLGVGVANSAAAARSQSCLLDKTTWQFRCRLNDLRSQTDVFQFCGMLFSVRPSGICHEREGAAVGHARGSSTA